MSKGRFVWFDANSSDPAATKAFYGELFGWRAEPFDGPSEIAYDVFKAGDAYIGGTSKLDPQSGAPSHWLTHLEVENVDEAVALTERSGGKIVVPPYDMPTVGRSAIVMDPGGAYFGLFKPESEIPDPSMAPNTFVWNELYTGDVDKALKYYEKLAGWTYESFDMGEQGVYHVGGGPEDKWVGLMKFPPNAPEIPYWQPYVAVADTDASVEKAKTLGGQAIFGPMDIPDVGRFAILQDPTGAMLAIIRFQERIKPE